jgi:hypothetical protein
MIAEPSGADVARLFHEEAVAPVLAREFPRLRYAAARLGSGSASIRWAACRRWTG